ncbi:MAG: Endonuclease/Exonuclease/phosphatase family protein [Chloroflexi bacterium ADurb.Bin325]|nr:MAG: Endonuclease/Exonuclease/phosphatase family protein [Chloroflexi bacterium ADurb.Bin325]
MKVLTYNIHGWRTAEGAPNVALVAEVIAASDADLVGLNEVFHPQPASAPALADLAARLGMSWAFGPTQPAQGRPDNPPDHPPYGNALLSRWPILAYAAHHLAPMTSYGKRGMLETRVVAPSGRPLTIYVTHLDHRVEALRLEQWAAALTWLLRDRARQHLLLGDFNALAAVDYPSDAARGRLAAYQQAQNWPPSAFDLIDQIRKAGYVDAYDRFRPAEAAPEAAPPGATFPAAEPERRIDYIFASPAAAEHLIACRPFDHPTARSASDHLPVLAEFDALDG